MESVTTTSSNEATLRFKRELKQFLITQLGVDQYASDRVIELTTSQVKGQIQRQNLDDLNDMAKIYLTK